MKFTHYCYKCRYFLPVDIASNKYEKNEIIANQRYQINLNYEYQTSYINIFSNDTEIPNLDIGFDFSHPNYKIRDRSIGRMFLNFIIKGKGRINGEPFRAGQLYYTLPNEAHTVESDSDDPYVSVWISLRGSYINHIVAELDKKGTKKILPIERRNDIMEITKTFLYRTNLGETSTSFLKHLINIYLSFVVSPRDNLKYPDAYANDKITRMIHESRTYVRNNLKDATVADMAAIQHYSTKYFSRLFTKAMGIKPTDYITDCRIEWAKNALEHSTLSIAEITEAVGYEHRNGFVTAFKRKYGCTPAAYRKKIK